MLNFLFHFIELFLDCVPRLDRVDPNEQAVFAPFYFCRPRVVGPGVYPVIPAIMYWKKYCVVSQPVETAVLSVTTEDDQAWQWRLGVEYEIHDVIQYDLGQYSGQQHVEMRAGSILIQLIADRTGADLRELGVHKVCNLVLERVRDAVASRGVTVIAVHPLMASRCLPVFVSQAERLVN